MFSGRSIIIVAIVAFVAGTVASLAIRPAGSPSGADRSAGPASYQTAVRHHWRVPLSAPRSLPGSGETPQWLAQALNTASGGAFNVELFDPGEIVPAFAITDAVRDHKVQAGYTWLGYDQGKIPASALIAAKPFGMEPWAYIGWWYHGDGRKLTEQIYAEHNIMPLLCSITGPETAGWFAKPLQTAEDLQGLKIRFAGLGGKAMQRVGASVTMLPAGEIFQALETGVIDATEYSQPITDRALGFSRIAKYNYYPGWHQPFSSVHLVVNLTVWNNLREDERSMVDGLCMGGVAFGLGLSESLQGPVIAEYAASGVIAQQLPAPLLAKLRVAANEVMDEEAANDPDFAAVLTSQREYQRVYKKWRDLAYLSGDQD
jgi:TRAP-type mannitol/chloroaromatic compound transport system substrate-binding protein